jgi:hypothetical protein
LPRIEEAGRREEITGCDWPELKKQEGEKGV